LINYLEGLVAEWQQLDQNLSEVRDLNSRYDLPVFHKEIWYPLKVKYSEAVDSDFWDYKYGDNIVYSASGINYHQTKSTEGIAFKLPDTFVDVNLIVNQIVNGSQTLVKNIDYVIDLENEIIIFKDNLFQLENWQIETLFDINNNVIDEELTLWCFNAQFDWNYVQDYLGYVFGILEKSTQIYKDVLNGLWDISASGLTRLTIKSFLSLLTGIPISKADEIIESIFFGNDSQIVVTDKNAYSLSKNSNLDILYPTYPLYAGDSLCDGFSILELTTGTNLSSIPANFSELTLPASFFKFSIKDALTFQNADLAPWVDTNPTTGKTLLRFEISGLEEDKEKFWAYVDAHGEASGKTLAEYLDIRVNKVDQPTIDDLPAAINPAKFIIQNFLGNNLFLMFIDVNQLVNPVSCLNYLKFLYKLIPAHNTFLLFIRLEKTVEYIDLLSSAPADSESVTRGVYDGTVSKIMVGSDPGNTNQPCSETYSLETKLVEKVKAKLILNNIW
jgi:hypothetical protein